MTIKHESSEGCWQARAVKSTISDSACNFDGGPFKWHTRQKLIQDNWIKLICFQLIKDMNGLKQILIPAQYWIRYHNCIQVIWQASLWYRSMGFTQRSPPDSSIISRSRSDSSSLRAFVKFPDRLKELAADGKPISKFEWTSLRCNLWCGAVCWRSYTHGTQKLQLSHFDTVLSPCKVMIIFHLQLNNIFLWHQHFVQTVALDPRYGQRKTREFVSGGLSGQLLFHAKVIWDTNTSISGPMSVDEKWSSWMQGSPCQDGSLYNMDICPPQSVFLGQDLHLRPLSLQRNQIYEYDGICKYSIKVSVKSPLTGSHCVVTAPFLLPFSTILIQLFHLFPICWFPWSQTDNISRAAEMVACSPSSDSIYNISIFNIAKSGVQARPLYIVH